MGYGLEARDFLCELSRLSTCEEAVDLASESNLAGHRDSRGLARVLTGDIPGAIEDFEFFVENININEQKNQRQDWIVELNAGRDPFTSEVIEMLFDQ